MGGHWPGLASLPPRGGPSQRKPQCSLRQRLTPIPQLWAWAGARVSSRARLLLWLESCFQKEGWSFTLRDWEKQPDWGGWAGQWGRGSPSRKTQGPSNTRENPSQAKYRSVAPAGTRGVIIPQETALPSPTSPDSSGKACVPRRGGGAPGAQGSGEGLGSAALPSSCPREEAWPIGGHRAGDWRDQVTAELGAPLWREHCQKGLCKIRLAQHLWRAGICTSCSAD